MSAGEWLAIVGASGAGKSTLLNLLGGLDTPSAGGVSVAGECSPYVGKRAESVAKSATGFCVSDASPVARVHGARECGHAGKDWWCPKQQAEAKAKTLLEQLGLSERLNHRRRRCQAASERVAIARALVNEPACVLMDEPTGNLDPDTAEQVLAAMSALRDRDTAFVVVTHDPAIAQRMDRQLTLANGRLEPR
ncbi:MAG: lipoprotein-releasing system ATP-binding protein LolD [Gammaproteobacteria bacterium]|nr:MAG: lipoprotein-releasing system ATP-binding protein LolD [Gammaproteobacteria bacterium]